MAPKNGSFGVSRNMLDNGYFLSCFRLTKSGAPYELNMIDTTEPKSPCVVTVTTKHNRPLPTNISVYITFYSHGKCVICDSRDVSIELF